MVFKKNLLERRLQELKIVARGLILPHISRSSEVRYVHAIDFGSCEDFTFIIMILDLDYNITISYIHHLIPIVF